MNSIPRNPNDSHRTRRQVGPRGSNRSAFTLVEMLVVITVFAFLLASVAVAMGALFRAQGDLQDELAQAHAATRLASQLRADAHLAASGQVAEDGETTSVRLQMADGTAVNYVTESRRVVRSHLQDDVQVHREVFSFLEGTTIAWELSSESPAFVTLTTSYRSPALPASSARPVQHRIEASIGLYAGAVK